MDKRDKIKGMLWGLVVGDCLGAPIQALGDDRPYITEMQGGTSGFRYTVEKGEWTDDSSMAFCIMDSFLRKGCYDLRDIAKTFLKWLEEGYLSSHDKAFDVGGSTGDALLNFKITGELAYGKERTQGNGSIMRFAPSYVMNLGNADDKMLHEISDITHRSNKVHEIVSTMRRICDSHLAGRKTDVMPDHTLDEVIHGNTGWAVLTMAAALHAFHETDSFEEGMIRVVNYGGDTDSTGAVFGQIAGSYYGYEAIPKRWIQDVKDYLTIDKRIEDFIEKTGAAK
ncbi:MAG: ADP-ribosylglycohydrolase family protein [Victivallaceae bacterium]|nr:ADP-ribosylglycohydrolase family protein [Victivallaceae bacterium]